MLGGYVNYIIWGTKNVRRIRIWLFIKYIRNLGFKESAKDEEDIDVHHGKMPLL
jgi:hypothetical protein